MSASITGYAAFFNKLTQSLAPMMGYSVLTSTADSTSDSVVLSHSGLLGMCCLVGTIVGVRFYMWMAHFGLRGSKLKRVKAYVGRLHGTGLMNVV